MAKLWTSQNKGKPNKENTVNNQVNSVGNKPVSLTGISIDGKTNNSVRERTSSVKRKLDTNSVTPPTKKVACVSKHSDESERKTAVCDNNSKLQAKTSEGISSNVGSPLSIRQQIKSAENCDNVLDKKTPDVVSELKKVSSDNRKVLNGLQSPTAFSYKGLRGIQSDVESQELWDNKSSNNVSINSTNSDSSEWLNTSLHSNSAKKCTKKSTLNNSRFISSAAKPEVQNSGFISSAAKTSTQNLNDSKPWSPRTPSFMDLLSSSDDSDDEIMRSFEKISKRGRGRGSTGRGSRGRGRTRVTGNSYGFYGCFVLFLSQKSFYYKQRHFIN